jgi:hypothetical protein
MNKLVNLTVLTDKDAAVCEARGGTYASIGELSATGSAKKHPQDTSDNEVGFNLAVARALRALADQYEKRAEEAMSLPLRDVPQRYIIGMDPTFSYGGLTTTTTLDKSSLYSLNEVQ